MTKVIKRFRDKETNKVHEVGETYEGDAKRVTVLQKAGYLNKEKLVEKSKPAKKTTKEGE